MLEAERQQRHRQHIGRSPIALLDDALELMDVQVPGVDERLRPLGLAFPAGIFSLSHVALPFPINDSLYGMEPDSDEDFGIHLGALAPRGERGVLIVNLDALLRVSSNPFFPYVLGRIEQTIRPDGS